MATTKEILALQKYMHKEYSKIGPIFDKRFDMYKHAKTKLEIEYEKIIDDFYEKIDRKSSYRPRGDLNNTWKIIIDDVQFDVSFDEKYMKYKHHQKNKIIFNNVFLEGYHGGSRATKEDTIAKIPNNLFPSPVDVPYYRMSAEGEGGSYPLWGDPASQSESPYKQIKTITEIFFDDFKKELHKELIVPVDKIIDDVNKRIDALLK